ncbi:flavin-containing monooxygenase [Nonomuraea sediminis]|uniref:flavin-containing monooxygenase n=1 Tax=Nonomuraea sediminis TaxID=2835864 RepID=UPI0027E14C42|nr:NAD(P)/FAD-dependent oxidoreductase [Nonomuraea sediminis]
MIVIVGAGFAGLGTAIRLLQEGHRDLVVLEQADDVGGTWRDNTYPGCACDIPSLLYSFSFAPNPDWSRRYAPQHEIERYLRRCVRDHGLEPHLRLGIALQDASWDARRSRWNLRTSAGPLSARVLIMAQGPLSEPAVPTLPGLDDFAGWTWHSARWQHDRDLRGKHVAVIGTGASAIQFVPQLQRVAERVTVFQRTPPWIMPRGDRPIPAWRRGLYRQVPALHRLARGWDYLIREAGMPALLGNRSLAALGHRQALAHLHRQVADPELRAKLTPDYEVGCKRILISDDYYPALAQPNVELVTDPISRITADTVVTGTAHPADVLIFGTGFRVTDAGFAQHITGVDRQTLEQAWKGSPQAYLGTTVTGFPNLFLMAGPNTGVGHTSLIYMIESQINYLVDCLRVMDRRELAAVEVRAESQDFFNAEVQRRVAGTVWATGGCAAWYQDADGRVRALWPEPTWRFRARTRAFDLAHYTTTARRPVTDPAT